MEYQTKWIFKEVDISIQKKLIEIGISPLIATLLVNRGIITPTEAEQFLNPALSQLHSSYFLLDLDRAIKRIRRYAETGKPILIYGDDDVDGITGTLVLVETFTAIGLETKAYIPNRVSEDHKISYNLLEWCRDEGISLIVTVDNGTTSVEEITYGNEIGVNTIICDHHECSSGLPPAVAIINPKQPGCPYPFKWLAGVGLAYKIAQVLLRDEKHQPLLQELLELVALGSISDKVPLIDENRVLVHFGLKVLQETKRPGLAYLMRQFNINEVSLTKIASTIIPLLTSGRTDDGNHYGYDLLRETDPIKLKELYKGLTEISSQWKEEASQAMMASVNRVESLDLLDENVIIVVDRDLPVAYLGKCAAKLRARFNRPAIVMSYKKEYAVGEARSIEGFDLVAAFQYCQDLLIQYGGHKPAAGFTIPFENISAFQDRLFEYAKDRIDLNQIQPKIEIDQKFAVTDIEPKVLEELHQLEPIGPGNPQPIFYAKNVQFEPHTHSKEYLGMVDGVWVQNQGTIPSYELSQLPSQKIDILYAIPTKKRLGISIAIKDFRLIEESSTE